MAVENRNVFAVVVTGPNLAKQRISVIVLSARELSFVFVFLCVPALTGACGETPHGGGNS